MTIQYALTLAQDRLQAIIDHIDDSGGPGTLVVGTSALSGATGVLFTLTLDVPMGTISTRTLTFAGTPIDTSATAAGTAAKAEIRDVGGNVVVSGLTVGISGSGANIIMDTVSITVSRPVRLVSGTITHP